MNSRRWGFALIVMGVVGLLVTAALGTAAARWGWDGYGWMTPMHRWMTGAGLPGAAAAPVEGAEEVTILADDFSFSPARVDVKARTTVNLVLDNQGELTHDLVIPSLGFRLVAAPGDSVSGSILAATPGTHEFFCSVPGHLEAGMAGLLVVR